MTKTKCSSNCKCLKNWAVIGIDPGVKGAICLVEAKSKAILGVRKFTPNTHTNVAILNTMLNETDKKHILVVCEKGQAYSGNGSVSSFNFGFTCGSIFGAAISNPKVEWLYVTPKEWQKYFEIALDPMPRKGLSAKEKQQVKTQRRKQIKQNSIQKAKDLYPALEKAIGKNDGVSDAILIALYGISKLGNYIKEGTCA